MTRKHFNNGFLIFTLSIFAAFSVTVAAQDVTNQKTEAKKSSTSSEDINVRYARKRLEIAKTDLQIAIAQNRRITNRNSTIFLTRLKTQVELAEMNLAAALKQEKVGLHQLHIKRLESSVDLAKSQLNWVREVNKGIPGAYRDEQTKRAKLRFELAGLELERAKSSDVTKTPVDHLQWQIDQLQSEILWMRLQLEQVNSDR